MSSEQLADGVNPLDAELAATWDVLKGYSGRDTDLGIGRRFGGASMAFSLRDVGAMNGRVVRVRREPHDTDATINDEQDFSANQVQSGALEDWVNGKLESTLPADVDTAAAAYSLRKVNSSYGAPTTKLDGTDGFPSNLNDLPLGNYNNAISGSTFTVGHFSTNFSAADSVSLSLGNNSFTLRADKATSGAQYGHVVRVQGLSVGKRYTVTGEFRVIKGNGSGTVRMTVDISDSTSGTDEKGIATTNNYFTPFEVTALFNDSGANINFIDFTLNDFGGANAGSGPIEGEFRNIKIVESDNRAVRIRRSSDNVEVDVDFDAEGKLSTSSLVGDIAEQGGESGSTTATDLNGFLNETLTVGTAVNGTGSFPYDQFTANGNTGFDADNKGGGTSSAGFPYAFANGDVIVIRYTVSNFDSESGLSPGFRGTNGTNSVTAVAGGGTTFTANGTYTDTLTATADGTHIMCADGNTGSYTISNFEIVSHTHQAFVHTWYDQVGSNNAVQETATYQPKIAENGALLTDGIDFDGSDNYLTLSSALGATTNQSIFTVLKSDNLESSSTGYVFDNRDGGSDGSLLYLGNGDFRYLVNSQVTVGELTTTNEVLVSAINNSSNGKIARNAVQSTSATGGALNVTTAPRIGATSYAAAPSSNHYDGTIKEIVVYNSDQSDNRFKIESNINNYYGLYNDANEVTGDFTSSGAESFTANGTDGFTLTNSTSTAFGGIELNQVLAAGEKIYVSFNLSIDAGANTSPNLNIREGSISGTTASNEGFFVPSEGFNSTVFTSDSGGDARYISFGENDADPSTYTISDFKVSRIARNGFVETWYDQSGNGFDLKSQSADTQPFIVNNGGFTGGVYSPSRLNNSTKQYLEISDPDFDSTNITSSKFGWLAVMANMEENDGSQAGGVILGNTRNTQSFPAGSIALTLSDTNPNGRMFVTNLKTSSTGDFIGAVDNDDLFTSETIGTAVVDGSSLSTFLNGTTGSGTFTDLTLTSNVHFKIFQASDSANNVYYQNAAQGFIKELMFMQGDTIDDIATIRNEVNNHYNIF